MTKSDVEYGVALLDTTQRDRLRFTDDATADRRQEEEPDSFLGLVALLEGWAAGPTRAAADLAFV